MDCPKCGFAMSDLDTECPRCKRQGPPPPAKGPQAPASPSAKAGPPSPVAPAAHKSQFPFGAEKPVRDTNNSGSGGEPPAEVGELGWCWGAFGMPYIWGIGNRVWLAFIVAVPYVGPFFTFYLGAVGHKLAWQNRRFESFQQYRDTMRRWNSWGMGAFGISATFIFFSVFLPVLNGSRGLTGTRNCTINGRMLSQAMMAYAQDHGAYPPANNWTKLVAPYHNGKEKMKLKCCAGAVFTFNKNLACFPVNQVKDPSKTGAWYEADKSGKLIYPHPNVPTPRPEADPPLMIVGFADGHSDHQTEAEVKALIW